MIVRGNGTGRGAQPRRGQVCELVLWEVDGGKPTFWEDTVSAGTIIVIVVVLVLVAVVAAVASMLLRRRAAEAIGARRGRIGPAGRRGLASARHRRSSPSAASASTGWASSRSATSGEPPTPASGMSPQEQFVDNPAQPVEAAAAMIAAVTADLGYDITDQRAAPRRTSPSTTGAISTAYRQARTTAARAWTRPAPRPQRRALIGYRVLFLRPARIVRRGRARSWPDSGGARVGGGQGARPAAVAAGHPGAALEDQAPGRRRQRASHPVLTAARS